MLFVTAVHTPYYLAVSMALHDGALLQSHCHQATVCVVGLLSYYPSILPSLWLLPVFPTYVSRHLRQQEIDLPALEPEVTSVSSPVLVKLAKHLADSGAKMYGAFWCSHCYDQKLVCDARLLLQASYGLYVSACLFHSDAFQTVLSHYSTAFIFAECYLYVQAFGSEAAKYLPYVECYPDGYRKGVQLAKACQDANIEGFPTWVIKGQVLGPLH